MPWLWVSIDIVTFFKKNLWKRKLVNWNNFSLAISLGYLYLSKKKNGKLLLFLFRLPSRIPSSTLVPGNCYLQSVRVFVIWKGQNTGQERASGDAAVFPIGSCSLPSVLHSYTESYPALGFKTSATFEPDSPNSYTSQYNALGSMVSVYRLVRGSPQRFMFFTVKLQVAVA